MKKNTIVFDLDGTLLGSLEDIFICVNYALSQQGLPRRTKDEVRSFLGNGYRYLIAHAVSPHTNSLKTEQVLDSFRAYYQLHCQDVTKPYDGISEMLDTLRDNGYKMAIVSNKDDEAVKQLAARFFSPWINIAVGESKEVRRKPNPDAVLQAIKQLGSKVEDSIYVGDSEVDIATAKNAGIPCIACLWGFRDEPFLLENGATQLIKTPRELLSAVQKPEW